MLNRKPRRHSVLTFLLPCVLTSSQGKQHRLGGRRICDGLELWVMPAERLRHLHFRSLQDADELQRVDYCFALKVIVGDDKRLASPLRDFVDASNPRRQLFGGVKIVVALVRRDGRIVAEPSVVAAPVQPHVSDRRGSLRGRPKRSPDNGLIDVAKTDAAGAQQFQRFGRTPRAVAYFDHQRIVRKPFQYGREVRDSLRRAMKRKRKLQQDGAEFVDRAKHIEARANGAFIRRRRSRRYGSYVVRESLPEFGGEHKARIRRHAIDPLRRVVRTQRLVKRSVDLDSVKEFREIGRLVESLGSSRWIDVTGPIRIRPARRAYTHTACRRRTGRPGIGSAETCSPGTGSPGTGKIIGFAR